MHAVQGERRVRRIEEGADIERRAGVGRDPGRIDLHELLDRLQAVVLVDARKAETVAGAVEPGDIFPRAEELHTAVRAAVGLEALKDLGAVVQDAGRRGHGDGPEGHDARVVPAVLVSVVHEEHVVGENGAEAELVGGRKLAGVGIFRNSDVHNDTS